MSETTFEILKLVLQIVLIVMGAVVLPNLKAYLAEKTTKEQRENAKFWASLAISFVEDAYEGKGQGKLKKANVISWLKTNGINITADQMDILIDEIVKEFNDNNWDIDFILD